MDVTRRGVLGAVGAAVAAAATAGGEKGDLAMARPKVLFFDVNETLLDLKPLKQSVGEALGGRPELVPL